MKPAIPLWGSVVGEEPKPADPPVAVLLVNDNPATRIALASLLAPLDVEVVEADSGVSALRRLMVQDFAVILLDVRMPVMGGFETAALIRQRQQSELTPIIFITAHAGDEIGPTGRYVEGAVDFLLSSAPPEELRAKVSFFAGLFARSRALGVKAAELQVSADQLRLLTDSAPVGIFQADTSLHYVYTNPRWSEITGIPAVTAAGGNWETLVGSPPGRPPVPVLPDLTSGVAEFSRRFGLTMPDGTERVVLETSRSVPDADGETVGWVGTLSDVSSEAGAEAALADARDAANEASQLKSDFLANMSHEIRTPMNGVIGMTDLLLETDLDVDQRDFALTVRNSGEALLTIINDILDFSRIEAGMLEAEKVEFELRAVVGAVVDLLAGGAQSKGLELVAVVERTVPTVVVGDPGRLRQVLTNLLGNAIKFTGAGQVVLTVRLAGMSDADALLHIEVSDTGDGIAPDKLAQVFEPFVQSDTSTSRKYGGTGLGLAISSQLVELMGGRCGASSTVGVGSTFWFTVRVRADPGQPGYELSAPDPALAGVRVLVVVDNSALRDALCGYLTDWGMSAGTADSGGAALLALRSAAATGAGFALALVDRSLPGGAGDLSRAITGDAGLDTRLVLLTDLRRAPGAGRDPGPHECPGVDEDLRAADRGSVTKPVHLEQLRGRLRGALPTAGPPGTAPSAPATVGRRTPDGRSPGAARLLLAEDNLINQKVAVVMLSGAGYVVDTVLNGAAAVLAAAAHPYDAVLMDCQMPEMNGFDATAAIRVREGSGRHTPIIAMTAGARPEDEERCLAGGMDAYLSKPVTRETLLAVVARSVAAGRT